MPKNTGAKVDVSLSSRELLDCLDVAAVYCQEYCTIHDKKYNNVA